MVDNISPQRRAMMEREKANNAGGGRGNFYNLKDLKDDVIRLLPLREDEPIGTKYVYYFINKKSYTCPEETFGQNSVIAKSIRALTKLGTDDANQMVAALKDARRFKFLMKIVARSDASLTPKWMEAPNAIYKIIFEALEKDGYEVWKPKTGRDIRISKTGTGKTNTRYTAAVKDQSELAPTREERDALAAESAKMDPQKLIAPNEAGALEALKAVIPPSLWSQIEFEVTGKRSGNASAASAASAAPARRAAPAPAGDDEDAPSTAGGNVDDEEGGAPAPAPARSTKAAPAVVDDEEGPAPAPKAAAASTKASRPAAPVADDDEEGARPPANKGGRAAPAAVVVKDDEEAPPSRPAAGRRHAIQDDEE